MKKIFLFVVLLGLTVSIGCGSSSSSGGGGDTALKYANFGVTLNNVIPDGLKTGSVTPNISALMSKSLDGTCADYIDCPYVTVDGGGDNQAGEILMRLWAMDYHSECTEALLTAGTCFTCDNCGPSSQNYIQPTMLADPTACPTTSTMSGRYVNFGIDPCFFDAGIAQISNIAECETVHGGSVDISTAVPWYASWGLPQTVDFSSYYSTGNGGMWWTLNNGAAGTDEYFLSLNPDWLYVGVKDVTNDKFMFFGSGSAAYFATLGETGGSGVNISAYYGPLSTITKTFEAIQVRDQSFTYIERIKSNGTHLWYQGWFDNVPLTLADVDDVKNSPSENRCLEIGSAVVTSKYVPFADCVTSFDKVDVDDLNKDDNYTLKVIDIHTAGLIDFSGALTPTTHTSCLEEVVQ